MNPVICVWCFKTRTGLIFRGKLFISQPLNFPPFSFFFSSIPPYSNIPFPCISLVTPLIIPLHSYSSSENFSWKIIQRLLRCRELPSTNIWVTSHIQLLIIMEVIPSSWLRDGGSVTLNEKHTIVITLTKHNL